MIDAEQITHKTAVDVFRSSYVRRVGVGTGRMSYADLFDLTGIPVRTLKSWPTTEVMPHLDNFLKLCVVFGPGFASEVLGIAGLGGVERMEESLAINAMSSASGLVSVANELLVRLEDGVFCHRDKAAMGPKMIELSRKIEEQGKAMLANLPGKRVNT